RIEKVSRDSSQGHRSFGTLEQMNLGLGTMSCTNEYSSLNIIPLGNFISLRNASAQQNLTRPIQQVQDIEDNSFIQSQTNNQAKEKNSKKNDGCHCSKTNCKTKVVHAEKTMHFVQGAVVVY
ncbi:15529_t:CDS:2, partial [Dentiscutata heterogama]